MSSQPQVLILPPKNRKVLLGEKVLFLQDQSEAIVQDSNQPKFSILLIFKYHEQMRAKQLAFGWRNGGMVLMNINPIEIGDPDEKRPPQ